MEIKPEGTYFSSDKSVKTIKLYWYSQQVFEWSVLFIVYIHFNSDIVLEYLPDISE